MALNHIDNFLRQHYFKLVRSVAFLPTVITFLLIVLNFVLLTLDKTYSNDFVLGEYLGLKTTTIVTLLGSITTGVISLMVFSFSTVMIIFNLATSNMTPRLIPATLKERYYKFTLGIFLGTIACSATTLSLIDSSFVSEIPTISILYVVVLLFLSLGMFVHFINQVTNKFQVGTIIHKVYQNCVQLLNTEKQFNYSTTPLETTGWMELNSERSGFLFVDKIRQVSQMYNLQIKFEVALSAFVNRGDLLLKVNRELNDEEKERLHYAITFAQNEDTSLHWFYGFKHLTEIAVRALSPGINDPGTAIEVIQRLTDLMIHKMQIPGHKIVETSESAFIAFKEIDFDFVLFWCFVEILNFTDSEFSVLNSLISMLETLERNDVNNQYVQVLEDCRNLTEGHIINHFAESKTKDYLFGRLK